MSSFNIQEHETPQERQAAINVQLFRYGEEALAEARTNRPKNTKKNYDPKQKEWVEFCSEIKFSDGELVTEKKLIWFLKERVLTRSTRRSRYSKHRTDEQDQPVVQTLGRSAVSGYVAAIVDLWSFQKSGNVNPHPNPRGEALNAVIRTHSQQEHARKRKQFADRAIGTLADGYDEVEKGHVVRCCWCEWQKQQTQKGQSVESYLRTAFDFLCGHNMLLRGDNRRAFELPDLFVLEMYNQGPTKCFAMIIVMDNGKTNKTGRIEYGSVIRHVNPLLCTMGHLAWYFFYRWHIVRETPPRFQRRSQWYNMHVLKGGDQLKEMSYATQLEWTSKAFKAAGLRTSKITHCPRGQGSREAVQLGVPEPSVRRAGRWNNDSLSMSYLTSLPLDFVRSMAGFHHAGQGDYYLPRAKIVPPPTLVRRIWPWVDEWLAWLNGEGVMPQNAESDSTAEEDRDDLAAQGFLRLLDHLRTIILQDSIIMQEQFPEHPMWNDSLFAQADYKNFAREMKTCLLDKEEPQEILLRRTLPIVAERLTVVQQDLKQTVTEWSSRTHEEVVGLRTTVTNLLSGRLALTLQATPVSTSAASASASVSVSAFVAASASAPASAFVASASSVADPVSYEEGENSRRSALPSTPPTYQMSRTIETTHDLWTEWTIGLGGNPSVQSLEDTYGAAWRPAQIERVFFSRRKVIIDEIRTRHAAGISLAAAVEELELVRKRSKLSLHGLWKMLNASKKK
jgi:hypothetical protein